MIWRKIELREKFGINDVAEQGIFLEEANSGSLQDVCLTFIDLYRKAN
jgi:hypothetical protein